MNQKTDKRVAAIYIRVSTDAQAEEGYSIEAQKEQLSAYCVAKGLKKFEFYIDGGWSGSNINRPEMQRLIKDCNDHLISHCIVYKLDRLSRSQKDTLYVIEDVFIPNSVTFVSLNESIDTETPTGKMMIGIISAFAQLERDNIRLRTRMGMKERVRSGLWMGGGRLPFGYSYDKNKGILVKNEDAGKVKQIYQLYIAGKSPQYIANVLGLKYDRLVTNVLTRKINYGVIDYNGVEYDGLHEPIISKETYDIAMQCMADRSVTKVCDSKHLLTGLLVCGHCGAKMRYQKWGKNGDKIVCYSQQTTKQYLVKDKDCKQPRLWAEDVDDAVIKSLLELSTTYNPSQTEQKQDIDILTLMHNQETELKRKIQNLYLLYAENENEILLSTIEELQKQLLSLNLKINNEQKYTHLTKKRKEKSDILTSLTEMWNYLTDQEKTSIVRKLVKQVTVTDNNVTVTFSI